MIDRFSGAVHSDAGFTLVETVVAFAILALVTVVAVQIVGGGAVRARLAEERMAALAHAEAELTRLEAAEGLSPGVSTGAFPDGFRWTRTVAPLGEPEHLLSRLAPVLVTVEIKPARRDGAVALTTILLAAQPR